MASISGVLKTVGAAQDSVLPTADQAIKLAICSDEIFSKGEAILITIDPHSLAILSISFRVVGVTKVGNLIGLRYC